MCFFRTLSFYVWDIYVPSTLMVIVTWMSFWIDRKIIQGRCALGSLTMVAISNQINSVKSVLPPTAQKKGRWLSVKIHAFKEISLFKKKGYL